jgi:large subunit ribosomal protein L21
MKYAVFASGGKQYKVNEGSVVELEKIKVEDGHELIFDTVLLHVEDGIVKVGQPHVPDVTITAKVLGQIKARKVRVAKFKAKARYRKVYGHRQQLTKVQISSIGAKGRKKPSATTEKQEKASA